MAKGGILGIWRRMRRDSIEITRDLIEALNARDWSAFRELARVDLVYLDTYERRIVGREAFIEAFDAFAAATPGLRIETETFSHGSESVLVRGMLLADDPDFRSDTLWQVDVRDGQVIRLHAFRRNEADVPLYQIHREHQPA